MEVFSRCVKNNPRNMVIHIIHIKNLKTMTTKSDSLSSWQLVLLTDNKSDYELWKIDGDSKIIVFSNDFISTLYLNKRSNLYSNSRFLEFCTHLIQYSELKAITNEFRRIQRIFSSSFHEMIRPFLICVMEPDQYLEEEKSLLFKYDNNDVFDVIFHTRQLTKLCLSEARQDCFCQLGNILLDMGNTAIIESMVRFYNCISFNDLYFRNPIADCNKCLMKWILPMFMSRFRDDCHVFESYHSICDGYFNSPKVAIDAVFQSLRREYSSKFDDFFQIILTRIHKYTMEKQIKVIESICYNREHFKLKRQWSFAHEMLLFPCLKEKHGHNAKLRRRSSCSWFIYDSHMTDKRLQQDSEKEIKLTIVNSTFSLNTEEINGNSLSSLYESSKHVTSIVDESDMRIFFSEYRRNSFSSMKDVEKHHDLIFGGFGGRGLQFVVNLFVCPVVRSLEDTFSSLLSGVSRDEVMCNYLQRLASFSYVSEHGRIPSAIMMAKAGWYFTGILTETKCFSCRLSYSTWKHDDIPLQIHRDLNPACEFLLSIEDIESQQTENEIKGNRNDLAAHGDIPNGNTSYFTSQTEHSENIEKQQEVLNRDNDSLCQRNFQSQNPSPFAAENGHLLKSCYQNGTSKEQSSFYEERDIEHFSRTERPHNYVLLNEEQRKPSVFRSDSPATTNSYDKVCAVAPGRCDYSRLHASPEASISLDQASYVLDRNIQIEKPREKPPSYEKQLHLPHKVFANPHTNPNTNFQVPKQTLTQSAAREIVTAPKFPRYQSLPVRMSTFGTWPPTMQQKPKAMALAGFYYKGYGDAVVCYWCGITIVQWEDDDDPCIEHVRWQPTCFYMLSYKGDAFIALVKEQFQMPQSPEERQRQIEANNIAEKEFPPYEGVFDITPYVGLLDMGFAEENIEHIVRQLSLTTGNSKPHLDNVLDKLLQTSETNNRPNTGNDQERSRWPPESAMSLMPDANPSGFAESSLHDIRVEETGKAQDNTNINQYANKNEMMMCKICLDADVGVTFAPCGHLVSCVRCSQKLNKCPICRQYIQQKIKCYVT